MTTKKPKPKHAARSVHPASISDLSLKLMVDHREPVKRRAPLAISYLKEGKHRDAARKALESMAADKTLTPRMLARIAKAINRYCAKPKARPKRIPHLRKKAAAQAAALAPSKGIDLSGPHTLQIAMNPDMDAQWNEIHFNDAAQIWERRKAAVKSKHRLPLKCWDVLNAIPDYDLRHSTLDDMLLLSASELLDRAQ